MAYSFKRAAKAIAVTSSTTSVAFAANGFSPIIPIRAFGIYASIIVLVNYAMVVCIMPSVQIVYEDNYRHRCKGCDNIMKNMINWIKQRLCCPCNKNTPLRK